MLRCENPRLSRCAALLALAGLALVPAVAGAWPWSMDMANQISIKPQHGPDSVRPFPKRSVPMAGTNTLIHVHDRDGALALVNPNPATLESVARGRKFFQIFCTPCHGKSGTGDGTVGAKFLIRPFDLTADQEQKVLSEGYIFGTVTFGGALMPPYGNDMSPSEVWDVVNYVRHGLIPDGAASGSGPTGGKPK
ncbi:MAG: cytochrome c [Steroidobacteraceae bacterium]|jgi:mono/diheme cytochrome c family protein